MEESFPLPSKWFPIISISALQINAFRWAQNLAKNDHGIAFWGLAAFYTSLYLAPLSAGFAFFTGVLTGAAVVGKFTLAILGFCIGLNILLNARKRFFPFVFGGLVGSAPVFLRNYILTKNPVFPWLPQVFPSKLLSDVSANGSAAATQKVFQIFDLSKYGLELYEQSPLIISIVLMFVLKKHSKNVMKLTVFPILSYLIFTLTLRPSTGIRYQGPTLFIIVLFGVFFSFFLLNLILDKIIKSKKDWVIGAVSIWVIATSSVTFFTLFQIN